MRAARATPTSTGSICTRTCGWAPPTGRGWSSCAVTCCVRPWRRTASGAWPTGGCGWSSSEPGSMGRRFCSSSPLEFLEKLVALTPRPEINLVLYHGVLAPHARWRPDVVAHGRADGGRALDSSAAVAEAGRARTGSSRHWTWALLMRRAFDLDVLRCPRCAGRTQLIATIEDPAVIRQILAHLGFSGTRAGPPPPSSLTAVGAEQPALPGIAV